MQLFDTALPISASEACGATFDAARVYRYRLWRRWAAGPKLLWVMLNPSTADETVLDPTIRRCIGFAKRGGFGAIEVVNLFALRSTSPAGLKRVTDPVGPENDASISSAAVDAGRVIAAWGTKGSYLQRDAHVRRMLRSHGIKMQCLGTNDDNSPVHPLYQPTDAVWVPYWETT